jgi:predicted XRE-type DNA-binding protein
MEGKRFASVWDAIEDTPQAAASMKARSTLMMELSSYIEKHGLTQAQAADLLGVSQPRVSDLMRGKINLFSLDMLLNMATAAGMSPVLKLSKPKALPIRASAKQRSAALT